MGRPRDDLRQGLRSFVTGRYVVFYRISPDGIEILRALHGSRDAGAELAGDEPAS
jgi:toxin ParE1/3/4